MSEQEQHCIVYKCKNRRDQGRFIGDLCAPCYEYLRSGKIGYTQSFLGELKECRDTLKQFSNIVSENHSLLLDLEAGRI